MTALYGRGSEHFAVAKLEDLVQIIDMREDEIQIVQLPGPPQESDTAAWQARMRRGVAPANRNGGRLRAFGQITAAQQSCRNPGAADLVLLAKFASGSGADDRDAIMMPGEVTGKYGVAAKTGQIDAFATVCFVNHFRAGGRYQD